jgi:hypothetical protein
VRTAYSDFSASGRLHAKNADSYYDDAHLFTADSDSDYDNNSSDIYAAADLYAVTNIDNTTDYDTAAYKGTSISNGDK